MEKRLVRWFYRGFWIIAIICLAATTIMIIGTIESWNKYILGEYQLIIPIMFTGLLIISLILLIIGILPSLRDLPAVRKRNFETMTGTIIRYKRVQQGGEPPTHGWDAIVKDDSTGNEIQLNIINRKEREVYNPLTKKDEIAPEFYGTYNFIYLKHTKFAVIDDQSTLK